MHQLNKRERELRVLRQIYLQKRLPSGQAFLARIAALMLLNRCVAVTEGDSSPIMDHNQGK